jgi:hypothetical protein
MKITSNDFIYDENLTPVIDSLSIISASPILKTPLIVKGNRFGNDIERVRVYLDTEI